MCTDTVKAIFSEGFTETLCTGVYFQWMDSLKMQKQYSVFSEGFSETMGTEIYFQWMVHWSIRHSNLFSVNSFAENKVKVIECYTPYRSVCGRDVNETLAYETETFGFWSETRPRPRPSYNSTRPRRLIFATRRDRDRDLARPRPRRFSRPSTFSIVPKQRMANLPLLMSQTAQSLQLQLLQLQCSLSWNLFTT